MSDMGSKCPAERWTSAGHFVRHARNNFRDHCLTISHSYLCLTYPYLGTGVGVALGHWYGSRYGILNAGPLVSDLPLPIILPTIHSFLLATLRLCVGTPTMMTIRAIVKTIVFEISCAVSGVDRRDPRAKEELPVELPCKYITYIALGFNACISIPWLFTHLGIERAGIYHEL